jgi:hypothetical protein
MNTTVRHASDHKRLDGVNSLSFVCSFGPTFTGWGAAGGSIPEAHAQAQYPDNPRPRLGPSSSRHQTDSPICLYQRSQLADISAAQLRQENKNVRFRVKPVSEYKLNLPHKKHPNMPQFQ